MYILYYMYYTIFVALVIDYFYPMESSTSLCALTIFKTSISSASCSSLSLLQKHNIVKEKEKKMYKANVPKYFLAILLVFVVDLTDDYL